MYKIKPMTPGEAAKAEFLSNYRTDAWDAIAQAAIDASPEIERLPRLLDEIERLTQLIDSHEGVLRALHNPVGR